MKFTSTKKEILEAALIAERMVGKKESLPVLSCIYLAVEKDISLQATNLEAGVVVSFPGEVEKKGSAAVPVGVFVQTLRSVSAEKITISLEEGNVLVQAKGTKTLIKAVPHEEFPVIQQKSKEFISVSRTAIIKGLQGTLYAASPSMIRPELGSVSVVLSGSTLVCAATDSFRLAEKTVRGVKASSEKEVLIPLKHAGELVHVLERINEEGVEISVEDSQLSVKGGRVFFVSRVIDGTFPNYKEVIPKSFSTEVTLLKNDFAELLRKARVFSGQEQRVGLHVYPKKKVFTGTAQSPEVGEMSDSIEAAVSGDDIDIFFNISYISDCLQSVESDSVSLGFAGPGRPLVIKGASNQDFLYLVMPLNR